MVGDTNCDYKIIISYANLGEYVEASITVESGQPHLKLGGMNKSAAAYGYFNDTLLESGWSVLEVHLGNSANSDNEKIYAAGFLEGALTARQVALLS